MKCRQVKVKTGISKWLDLKQQVGTCSETANSDQVSNCRQVLAQKL